MTDPLGWDYPAGAENDPNAPWNEEEVPCEQCGHTGCECLVCMACDMPAETLINGICPDCVDDAQFEEG
jgi:hypothetical protein